MPRIPGLGRLRLGGVVPGVVKAAVGIAAFLFTEKQLESESTKWVVYSAMGLLFGVWFPLARKLMAKTGLDTQVTDLGR